MFNDWFENGLKLIFCLLGCCLLLISILSGKVYSQETVSARAAISFLAQDGLKIMGADVEYIGLPAGWSFTKENIDKIKAEWELANPTKQMLYISVIVGFDSTGVRTVAPILSGPRGAR